MSIPEGMIANNVATTPSVAYLFLVDMAVDLSMGISSPRRALDRCNSGTWQRV